MKRCIACGALLSEQPLLTIENMPAAAQHLPRPEDADTEHGVTLRLCACTGCGLIQLDSAPVPYYRDVIRSGGYSETMDKLRRAQYDAWIPAFHLEGKRILEAGCGQGEFLSILAEYPVSAYGMEHFHELVQKAREKGLAVAEEYPERENQIFQNAPFDAFTSFNFLEHQPDPVSYLRAIARNLTPDGAGLVTVPSFEYILEENSFYEFIPDHLSYFTEDSLTSLMNRCGFDVLRKERVNRDTISVWVQRKKCPDVSGLLTKQKTIAAEIRGLVDSAAAKGKVAIWGASHQGFSIAASLGLGKKICYIIDSAPFKQGHIAPASHIPIVSPEVAAEDPAGCILIVAPGYTDEIAARIREKFPAGTEIWTLRSDRPECLTDRREA